MKLSIYRGQRSRWFGYEWYNHDGTKYLNFSLGHPDFHKWWAFDIFIYF